MDFWAMKWVERETERREKARQMRELRQIVADLAEANAAIGPAIADANARRIANRRQEGPDGFVMIGG
jgi:hypothetical protein